MKCEKCGYENSVYDIICEKCGTPLNIENNNELKDKYNSKPRAIDIEEIRPDQEKIVFDNTKQKVRYVLSFLLGATFITIIVLCVYLIRSARSNDILTKYDKFIENEGIQIIYFGNDDSVNKLLKNLEIKYEISFLHINTKKITSIKRNRIKDDLKLDIINSTLVVVNNGKVIDYMNKSNSNLKQVNEFLIKNNIIPKEDGDPEVVKKNFEVALNSKDSIIIYIANNKNESNDKHNKFLRNFCKNYSINYVFIEGYYLSDNQKLSLLKKLNYSEIHDELFVIVDEGEIKEVDESVSDDLDDYFALASDYGIINITNSNSIKKVTTKQFTKLVSSKEKSVFFMYSDECVYCDKLKPIIGKIGVQNDIKIYSVNIKENTQESFETYIKKRGYKEEKITTPLVLISENNKILDYIIGYSDKEIYIDKFKANGVIR